MLVLSRKLGEEIVIADQIRVRVIAIHGQRIRLGITAPASVPILRKEIHENRMEFDWDPSVTIESLPKSA